jgi:ELWxxDGT repeat protein
MAGGSGTKLYSSSGTAPVEVTTTTPLSTVQYLQVYGNDLFISASGGAYTQGVLWDLSNTSAPASVTGSSPARLVVLGSSLYFSASDLTNGRQLWSYSGSSASMVYAITQNTCAGADALNQASPIVVFNNALHFPATSDFSGNFYLYTYSGSGNPAPVTGSPLLQDSAMAVCSGSLFLRDTSGALWKYDGASLTNLTNVSLTLNAGVTFGVLNSVLYFAATADGTHHGCTRTTSQFRS